MRTTIARALLSLSLASTLALPSTRARADEPGSDGAASGPKPRAPSDPKKDASASKADEASARFKSGVAFYKDKDFTAAMVEFKKAYELLPNYNVLFNIGQTSRELKDYAAALNAFEQYLREGGAKVAPARKKDVQTSIDELKRKVGHIKITTNVEGAEILVDDISLGAAPLAEPVTVNVGRRKLSATKSGYVPVQRLVDVASMEEAAVTLELAKVEANAPPPVDTPPEQPPPPPAPRVAPWVALSVTGAAAIATGIMGGLAVSARGTLKNELGKFPGDGQAIADAQTRTRTFAVTTDVLMGVSLAGAATTAVLFALSSRSPAAEKPKPVALDVTPAGIIVRGVF